MILTISEAARRAGVARSTLYEMKLRGDISFIKTSTGKQAIDLSELSRVFPHVVSVIPTDMTEDYSKTSQRDKGKVKKRKK